MRSFLDAKAMAKTLRQAMAEREIVLSQSTCQEIVARQFGFAGWTVLAAHIEAENPSDPELVMPADWVATNEDSYHLGLDPVAQGVAVIECRYDWDHDSDFNPAQFATLLQSITAENYRGKKVQLTAALKTEDADVAAIWMRIDKSPGISLRFDNLMMRNTDGALMGTMDWTERNVVLDVPEEAASIHYGFFLRGFGKVWARNLKFTLAAQTAASTGEPERYLSKPSNLDFLKPSGDKPSNLDFSQPAYKKSLASILAAMLLLSTAVKAADNPPGDIGAYRQRTAIEADCQKSGGKISYGKGGPKCELPKVVNKTEETTRIQPGKPAPVSTQH